MCDLVVRADKRESAITSERYLSYHKQQFLDTIFLYAVARIVNAYGDSLKDDLFKERIGVMSVKQLSRTAKERRPGSLGYAEAMLVAYNRKCKFPLRWNNLYEKNNGTTDGLDIDLPEEDGDDSEQATEL